MSKKSSYFLSFLSLLLFLFLGELLYLHFYKSETKESREHKSKLLSLSTMSNFNTALKNSQIELNK